MKVLFALLLPYCSHMNEGKSRQQSVVFLSWPHPNWNLSVYFGVFFGFIDLISFPAFLSLPIPAFQKLVSKSKIIITLRGSTGLGLSRDRRDQGCCCSISGISLFLWWWVSKLTFLLQAPVPPERGLILFRFEGKQKLSCSQE